MFGCYSVSEFNALGPCVCRNTHIKSNQPWEPSTDEQARTAMWHILHEDQIQISIYVEAGVGHLKVHILVSSAVIKLDWKTELHKILTSSRTIYKESW